MKYIPLLITTLVLVNAQEYNSSSIRALINKKIELFNRITKNKMIINHTIANNRITLTPNEINKYEDEWTNKPMPEFKKKIMSNVISSMFKNKLRIESNIYTEFFLTNKQGLNIAMYPETSDYWQGDEEKWIRSYAGGKGDVFVGNVGFDESTQTESVQISFPIRNNNNVIGVLIVGFKLSYLKELEKK